MSTKDFTAGSLGGLEGIIKDTKVETYSLNLMVPLTQGVLMILSKSPLGKNLETLKVHNQSMGQDDPVIDTSQAVFPRLKKLHMQGQNIQSFHFTADCYPMLEDLWVENPGLDPSGSDFHMDLPNLRLLQCDYFDLKDVSDFGPSLSRSPKLRVFKSYKLWGLGNLDTHLLVLPSITEFWFYRADDLKNFEIWAPRLKKLMLQSAYEINKVTLVDDLPAGYVGAEYQGKGKPTKYIVNCMNTKLETKDCNILTHERCRKIQGEALAEIMWG